MTGRKPGPFGRLRQNHRALIVKSLT